VVEQRVSGSKINKELQILVRSDASAHRNHVAAGVFVGISIRFASGAKAGCVCARAERGIARKRVKEKAWNAGSSGS